MTSLRVFITGGRRGIGAALVKRFTAAGHLVEAPGRQDLDLSSTASIDRFLSDRQDLLDVDVLVNNAGENVVAQLHELSLETWTRILDVNLSAALRLIQAVAPPMKTRGWGRIVNVSSIYSLVSRAGRAAYGASKAGLNSLTRTAAVELGSHGILVNAVCPGFIATELTIKNNTPDQIRALTAQVPLGRLASPDEIADLVLFLGTNANTFITGQAIVADGGFTCV